MGCFLLTCAAICCRRRLQKHTVCWLMALLVDSHIGTGKPTHTPTPALPASHAPSTRMQATAGVANILIERCLQPGHTTTAPHVC